MNTFVLSCTESFSGISTKSKNPYTVYSVRLGAMIDGINHTNVITTFTKVKVGCSVTELTPRVNDKTGQTSYEIVPGPSQQELDKLKQFDTDYTASNCDTLDLSEV